jgi:hypothetical protein
MRTIGLLLVAAVLAPAVGCSWIKSQIRDDADQGRGRGPIPPCPSAEYLVEYWNLRADRLQSIEYNQVHIKVSGKDVPSPVGVNLDGQLAAAQGRNFRMTGSGRAIAIKMDLGSNPDQFWMYLQAPGDKPVYVFASHTDFETGRAKMPGGIPFDPDWVMQALGMMTLAPPGGPAAPAYTAAANTRDRTYTLAWPARTPAGQPVRKEIVFDADPATGTRPQVKRHVVKDAKGKVLASAEVKSAHTLRLNDDPKKAVQYPTQLVLRWEEPKFEMDLTLETPREPAAVNQLTQDQAARYFTRRDYPNVSAIDLAGGTFR